MAKKHSDLVDKAPEDLSESYLKKGSFDNLDKNLEWLEDK